MNRYWIRIALSALGVFVIGMVIVSAGRRGVSKVRQFAMNQTVTLPNDVAPFRVDGRRLGTVRQVSFSPRDGESFPRVNLSVAVDSSVDMASLENCVLLARDAEQLQSETGLHCGSPSEQAASNLVEMGLVTFEPGGEVLQIFVPSHRTVAQAPGARGALVNLRADSAGAFMMIRDKNGRPIFQLNADSAGAFLLVRDSNGKEVVRFHADSLGMSGHVKQD